MINPMPTRFLRGLRQLHRPILNGLRLHSIKCFSEDNETLIFKARNLLGSRLGSVSIFEFMIDNQQLNWKA